MKTTVYEAVANGLTAYDTSIVFGLPSDDLLLMKEMKNQGIDFVTAKDQRNAMFMAIGYALASKKIGVCSVGKCPAVSNCITGFLEGESQSVPLLILASSTGTYKYGERTSFQEARQMEMVAPFVKWSHRLENPDSIGWVLNKAMFLATSGTPGPVYIEIPEDIGTQEVSSSALSYTPPSLSSFVADKVSITQAAQSIFRSKKPLLLLGGGAKRVVDKGKIEEFANHLGGPVFVTASGRGCFDEEHPLFAGLAGLYCPPEMQELVVGSDLILTLGSKLEETALFGWEESFKEKETLQINMSPEGFRLDLPGRKLLGEGSLVLDELLKETSSYERNTLWASRLLERKEKLTADVPAHEKDAQTVKVAAVLKEIQAQVPLNAIFVHENGLQDMWSYFYPYHSLKKGQDAIVPSEQTSLGFGAAAAVGAAKAYPDRPVIAIVGDGAFNLFQSDLPTLLSENISVIYIILRNGGYGWLEYQNRFDKDESGFINMKRQVLISEDHRLEVLLLEKEQQAEPVFQQALKHYAAGKSVLIDCMVEVSDVPGPLHEIYGDFPVKERV